MALTLEQIKALSDKKLLVKIMEESAEVTQAAAKHYNFGPRPSFAGVQYNNVADVNTEFDQLGGLLWEYRNRFGAI